MVNKICIIKEMSFIYCVIKGWKKEQMIDKEIRLFDFSAREIKRKEKNPLSFVSS